ncbi:MAG: hypothetical protein ACRCY8_05430 [Dermatophilaceae bacterium]
MVDDADDLMADPGRVGGSHRRSVRRQPRRAVRPGTSPEADDVPETPARQEPEADDARHDRWLHDQRPPHWG